MSQTDRSPAARPWLAYLALIAIGINLRGPLTSVPPVLDTIRAELGLSAPMAGLLTSIPVLCFGFVPPLLSPVIARLGMDRSIYIALTGSALGMMLRPWGGTGLMASGTLLIGISLAIGNIAALLVIARDFPRNIQSATGIYTAAMNIGAMLTIALTVPLARAQGWRMALADWTLLAVLAIIIWRQKTGSASPGEPGASAQTLSPMPRAAASLWQRRVVWIITAGFALHIFCYYALTAWLPVYLVESGTFGAREAGFVASSFQIFSLSGALGMPWLARRFPLGNLLVLAGAAWTAAPLWLLLAPEQWYLWSPLGSFAHGGTFVLIFMLIMEHARDLDDNRRISTLAQSVGYGVAGCGPILIGWLHSVYGTWTKGLLLIAGLTSILILLGLMIRQGDRPLSPASLH